MHAIMVTAQPAAIKLLTCLLKQRRDVCLDLSPETREFLHRRREFHLHLSASSHLGALHPITSIVHLRVTAQ
jgi:hypothetical protein